MRRIREGVYVVLNLQKLDGEKVAGSCSEIEGSCSVIVLHKSV